MSGIDRGFEGGTILLPLDRILPTRQVSKDVRKSQKYRTILASIREVGIIEPLAVHPEKGASDENGLYVLLDGHLRLEALKELGGTEAVCLVSTDDEGFTYNKRINRLSAVQEHMMILRAIEKGLAPERIGVAHQGAVNPGGLDDGGLPIDESEQEKRRQREGGGETGRQPKG